MSNSRVEDKATILFTITINRNVCYAGGMKIGH